MISAMPQGISGAHHSRRAVLSGCGLLLAGTLTGCDIRVERDAPHIPGVRTQSPPPDTRALRAALRRLRTLATTAESAGRAPATSSTPQSSTSSSGGATSKTSSAESTSATKTVDKTLGWAAQLATIHHQQATRVAGIIATSGATAPPSNPAISTGTVQRLRTLEVRGVEPAALGRLAGLSADNLPMLCAIAVTQGAGASMLGAEPAWPSAQFSTGSPTLALLSSVRSCVYALEVVAGRTPLKHRTLIRSTLATMYAARSRLVAAAGSSAPPPPVDYQLPVHLTDTASAHHLARLMLGRVVTACAAQSAHSVGDTGQISAIVRLWTEATAASWQWGTVPSAFPGLTE